jgi:hypothetical protein
VKKPIVYLSAVLTLLFWFIAGVIPQDEGYHNFADCRHFSGIPNSLDVLSNVPFFFVGVAGIFLLFKRGVALKSTFPMYLTFFTFVIVVGLGSTYYHLNPNSETLIWDRLPMSVAFMALLSFIVAEYMDERLGKRIFPWLLVAGVGSVVYWALFNDLRPYAIVQFFPLICLPVILWRSKNESSKWLWAALFFYVLAKVFEAADWQIFRLSGELVSGHSVKHVVSALATLMILFKVKGSKTKECKSV